MFTNGFKPEFLGNGYQGKTMYKIRASVVAFVFAVGFAVPASADWFTFEYDCAGAENDKPRAQVKIPNTNADGSDKTGAEMAAEAEKILGTMKGCKVKKRLRTVNPSDADVVEG